MLVAERQDAIGQRRVERDEGGEQVLLLALVVEVERAAEDAPRAPERRRPRLVGGGALGSDWERLSAAWREELNARIARLTRLRDQLSACIGCGCLSMETCPLRNPGDRLSKEGPGARLLEKE